MKKISSAQHTTDQAISHRTMRSRFGAAFVAGCLALSMCPAIALAAPGEAGGMQDGQGQIGNPPSAMQFDNQDGQQGSAFGSMPFGDQAPSGQALFDMGQAPSDMGQAPSDQQGNTPDMGQAPNNGQQQPGQAPSDEAMSGQDPFGMQGPSDMGPRADATDNQVRQILTEKYGITMPAFGENGTFQPGDPADAPELPEGAINVQAVIDTARDILREYQEEDLSAKIGDADFVAALKAFALSSTAQRMEMFANNERPTMENPSDLPNDEAPASDKAGTMHGKAVSDDLMSSIIDLIAEVFGYVNGTAGAVADAATSTTNTTA